MAESLSPLIYFPVSPEWVILELFHAKSKQRKQTKKITHSDHQMVFSFAIIGSIAATRLNFVKMPEC